MPSQKLSNYLRTYRKRAGFSQDEVAFLLGCRSGKKASRYECRTRTPSLETLLAYELILGAPVRELFAGIFQKVETVTIERARVLADAVREKPERLRTLAWLQALISKESELSKYELHSAGRVPGACA